MSVVLFKNYIIFVFLIFNKLGYEVTFLFLVAQSPEQFSDTGDIPYSSTFAPNYSNYNQYYNPDDFNDRI